MTESARRWKAAKCDELPECDPSTGTHTLPCRVAEADIDLLVNLQLEAGEG